MSIFSFMSDEGISRVNKKSMSHSDRSPTPVVEINRGRVSYSRSRQAMSKGGRLFR